MVQKPATNTASSKSRQIEILRRAAEVFRGRGFHRSSMEEIAERLGMTKGNLYYYFPGKQELLFFCQQEALQRLTEQAQSIVAGRGSAAEKLERLITAHLVCVLVELGGSLAHAEFEELPPLQRRSIVAQRDRYEQFFRDLIQAGVAAGEFAPGDEKLRALAILGALNWTVKWHRPEGGESATTIAHCFADLLVNGLRATPARPPAAKRRATT
jgi:AcrR family transcriptional regulator